MATIPTVLIVPSAKPYKSVADLVAAAKAKPGDIVGTTAGIGSATHMNLERFRISAGVEVLRLHMKGARRHSRKCSRAARISISRSPSRFGALRRRQNPRPCRGFAQEEFAFSRRAHHRRGSYPNSDYNFWVGALVPTRTPREVVLRLHREINAAVNAPEVRERIVKTGADPLTLTLPEFEAMIRDEFESNAKLIKAAGIKAN